MAIDAVSGKEYKEWMSAGLIGASTRGSSLSDMAKPGTELEDGRVLVDANKAAEIRAKIQELKSQVSSQSQAQTQDPRRSTLSMLGGDFSAYTLLSSNKKGNTLLG